MIVSGAVLLLCLQPGKWCIYALGLILGFAPLLFWVVQAGFGRVIENLFLYPVVYSSPGRRLPLFGENAEIPFYLCAIVGAAILILVSGAAATWNKRGEPNRGLLLALGCLAICVTPQVFQRAEPFEREFKGLLKFEPISRSHDGLVDILQIGRRDDAGYFY